ncbi:MAG: hypothetical protein D6734_07005 [Candidatus Schekmanbacteria bacterium]|nr:MAG: hypothetical protein D6734_07005 [Candidatus Schekmanbacteria bacterium]
MKLIKIEKVEINRDERGFSVRPIDEEKLKEGKALNLHIVSMNPGAIRGNHYHKKQEEKIWIIGGPCLVAAKNKDTDETEETKIPPDNDTILTISPNITHAIKNISDKVAYLLCYSDYSSSDNENDVFRDELI